uniref:Protein Rev n=1 Tax=Caprine arthritis encephalitis virus (strain Cork) TaxID=11661 RepID=REV_CAEVC|nr:RecName: Full=Protein Rev; AltName: Full=Rev-C [Caprine arthritis encephalitis virus strain Cork]AAB31026.1 Rev-C {alternatively spliced} [caprine arthritis encephalitis virus CAEV, Peptide, 133 aa] [Caprine arthritis encephalitis virus]
MDAGARYMRLTGKENWVEVTMDGEKERKREGFTAGQQDIQNSKYPDIPTGHSHHGNKSRRRRRKSGFWRWLRGIRQQRNKRKSDSTESLEPCLGALAELTLEGAMEKGPAEAARPSADDGNLDKWMAWRTPQK